MRSDDLVPLLTGRHDKGKIVAYWRFGTVVAWDGRGGTNQIRVGGTVLENLPSLAGTGALLLAPGDTVILGVAGTTMMVLGAVRSGPNFQFPIIGSPMSLGYGIISQWPTCSSASYVEMFYGYPEVMSPSFVMYVSTSVGASTTAQLRTLVEGVVVNESSVFTAGSGQYQPIIPWPAGYKVGDNPRVSLEMKRISGTNAVSASQLGIYAG